MSKKYKKICRNLNYIDHLPFVISTISGCLSISAFPSVVGIPIGIMSCTIGLKIFAITAGLKNYKPIIKEKKRRSIIK